MSLNFHAMLFFGSIAHDTHIVPKPKRKALRPVCAAWRKVALLPRRLIHTICIMLVPSQRYHARFCLRTPRAARFVIVTIPQALIATVDPLAYSGALHKRIGVRRWCLRLLVSPSMTWGSMH